MAPKVLLIDDDKVFAKQVLKEGRRQDAEIEWYCSFEELGRVGNLGNYDCVIADLSADPVTGIEIAQYATAFFSDLPVVLVSESEDRKTVTTSHRLPAAAQARIPKTAGAEIVLRTALNMLRTGRTKSVCPPTPRARANASRYQMTA